MEEERTKMKKEEGLQNEARTAEQGAAEKEYYTLKEVAELCGASYGTVKRDIDGGRLPAYRIGRKYFVRLSDLETYRQRTGRGRHVEGYTVRELMEKLPLSYAYLVELIKGGRLAAVKVGRQYIVPYDTFEQFMAEMKLAEGSFR